MGKVEWKRRQGSRREGGGRWDEMSGGDARCAGEGAGGERAGERSKGEDLGGQECW